MSGALGILPRQVAFAAGVVVPGAQLFCYTFATTTKRAIYTTSALSVQHENPLEADAYGVFPAFYVDPAGGPYKLVLAPAADADPPLAPFWTEDVVPIQGASIVEGNFTATLTGMDAATTGTVKYRITANAAGTGKVCRLYTEAQISGTSNTTAMTMTGLPAAVVPAIAALIPCPVINNNTPPIGLASIAAAATTIVFSMGSPPSGTGFTNSGVKGLHAGFNLEYAL